MTYTPRPEDLEEPAMSAELRVIADGVLPYNRERAAETFAEAVEAGRRIGEEMRAAMRRASAAISDFAAAHRAANAILAMAGASQRSKPARGRSPYRRRRRGRA